MMMEKEIAYTKSMNPEHIKTLGQYFTNPAIAKFMCQWACENAKTMLDPAVGNSIFLKYASETKPDCSLFGYEIDGKILDYFGNPYSAHLENDDYLLNGWDNHYDAIVCNPPYNRFQSVSNRAVILDNIHAHTGFQYSSYSNLYILFLIKSIYQMSDNGRLAYIVPTEFLNSKYGVSIKQLILDRRLLRAIINFQNDSDIFFNTTTTCCVLLLDKEKKDAIRFFNLTSIEQLGSSLELLYKNSEHISVRYSKICAEEKWRGYLFHEERIAYRNICKVSHFCSVSRGIATGANNFYCFHKGRIARHNIDEKFFSKCICRSTDVKTTVFTSADFDELSRQNKTVYLLNIKEKISGGLVEYIKAGEANGINKKYLPAGRKPWYSMEQKIPAPIWVSSAYREKIKFIRNLADINTLTTFHSVYINKGFEAYTDLIFCYFLTPVAQRILRDNRKELGNGLEKFQPNDLNSAYMLDVTCLSETDLRKVLEIYHSIQSNIAESDVQTLDGIFKKYLL